MPKHFLPLIGGKSLFQLNWESLRKKFSAEEIYLQTNEHQAKIAKLQVAEVVENNIFVEPEVRNQGPATGMAAAMMYRIDPDEPFMLIQVDDIRIPEEKLFETMDVCNKLAKETTKYITGGFRPEFAITGNDWLIKGSRVTEEGSVGVYNVDKFLWRGAGEESKTQAEKYFEQGLALIHANHTCMTPKNFLEMFEKYRVDWYEPLMKIAQGAEVKVEYAKLTPGPLEDVTQLVHANGESLVVDLPFRWIDIGTWESTDRYLKEMGLYTQGDNVVEIDSNNNFIQMDDGKPVAVIGLSDVVVIDGPKGLLVCKKSESGRVGEVVKQLK